MCVTTYFGKSAAIVIHVEVVLPTFLILSLKISCSFLTNHDSWNPLIPEHFTIH